MEIEQLKQTLRLLGSGYGLDSFGPRHDSIGVKGSGYFGPLQGLKGHSTEISSANDSGDFPLLAPTLSLQQIHQLLSGENPTEDIYNKAESWAKFRQNQGLSPFAENVGLKFPIDSPLNNLFDH